MSSSKELELEVRIEILEKKVFILTGKLMDGLKEVVDTLEHKVEADG